MKNMHLEVRIQKKPSPKHPFDNPDRPLNFLVVCSRGKWLLQIMHIKHI